MWCQIVQIVISQCSSYWLSERHISIPIHWGCFDPSSQCKRAHEPRWRTICMYLLSVQKLQSCFFLFDCQIELFLQSAAILPKNRETNYFIEQSYIYFINMWAWFTMIKLASATERQLRVAPILCYLLAQEANTYILTLLWCSSQVMVP